MGATGSGFLGLVSWQIVVCRRCPCCGYGVMDKEIDGIVPRCLRSETYRTMLSLGRIFCVKNLMTISPLNNMVWDE